ncbi:hypothetical protein AAGV37_18665 [Pseudomonas protegens]|uniref:hypothetical protein n=1 Tax=Pseudomonas protegens TaxID=380021 RepID=UPI003158D959
MPIPWVTMLSGIKREVDGKGRLGHVSVQGHINNVTEQGIHDRIAVMKVALPLDKEPGHRHGDLIEKSTPVYLHPVIQKIQVMAGVAFDRFQHLVKLGFTQHPLHPLAHRLSGRRRLTSAKRPVHRIKATEEDRQAVVSTVVEAVRGRTHFFLRYME